MAISVVKRLVGRQRMHDAAGVLQGFVHLNIQRWAWPTHLFIVGDEVMMMRLHDRRFLVIDVGEAIQWMVSYACLAVS